jgi:parvulin-like peptidyl-prolyl isomerase
MRYINSAIFLIAILVFSSFTAFAQESELKVVDEVVAQVNDSVVTLSRINREVEEIINAGVQEGKTREAATAEVNAKRGELIANIINEELLIQKAKDFDFDSAIEAQVNQDLIGKMKELNFKSLDELYAAMRQGGVDPDYIREISRKKYAREFVLQQEVDRKIYNQWKAREVKTYYEANKTKFNKPETVEISELFLSFAGKDPNAVREKAKQIVAEIRGGKDFGTVAIENSDRPDVKESKGKVAETLVTKDLDPKFIEGLKDLPEGGVTNPIEIDDVGVEIIKLDKRNKASSESFFDENAVRRVMTIEVLGEERKKYFVKLRGDSYIKINDKYRPEVAPLLFAEERKAEVTKEPGK